jgi:hypothetical protein
MTEVPRNSNFRFNVIVTNNDPVSRTVKVWTAAHKLPSGSMHEPLKGPVTITIGPSSSKYYNNIPQYIGNIPLATYRYYARVAENYPPDPLLDEDYVDFEVIP